LTQGVLILKKKRQKEFASLGARRLPGARANGQKFFASFFKKEGLGLRNNPGQYSTPTP
jgi:hypothetical protein